MTGPVRGSSSGPPDRDDEDEPIPNDADSDGSSEGNQTNNNDRIYLSRLDKGRWWDDRKIGALLGRSIKSTCKSVYQNWSNASLKQRKDMFDYFERGVRVDPGYDLRSGYEKHIKARITKLFYGIRKGKKKPLWMPNATYEALMIQKDDREYQKMSAVKKSNRRKGGKDEKAQPTHALGQTIIASAFRGIGPSATPHQLLVKSKKNKKGEWINPRSKEIDDAYQRLCETFVRENSREPTIEEQCKLYQDAVGGFDSKLRIYGVGNVAPEFFTPPSSRSRSNPQDPYIPSITIQVQETVNEKLSKVEAEQAEARREQEEARRDREEARRDREKTAQMMEFLRKKMEYQPDETCSSDLEFHRDDFADDGHGFGRTPPVNPVG